MTGQIATGTLWSSVDRLTKARKQRLVRTTPGTGKTVVEYVPIPSLLDQLQEAVASTNSSDGGPAKSTGSRAPLDVGITALLGDISHSVIRGLRDAGLTPRLTDQPTTDPAPTRATPPPPARWAAVDEGLGRPVHDPDHTGRLTERAARAHADARARTDTARHTHDVAADLRQLATHIAAGGAGQRYVDAWVDTYRRWVTQAETALALDVDDATTTRGIRDTACPTCAATSVVRYTDDETYWDPALVVSLRDGQVLHVTCRVCGEGWWRGDDLDQLSMAIAYPTRTTDHRRTS